MVVINPRKAIDSVLVNDADLTGPIIFCFVLALLLLLVCFAFYTYFVERKSTIWLYLWLFFHWMYTHVCDYSISFILVDIY